MMSNETTANMEEVENYSELEEGDSVTVEYKSKRSGNWKQISGEVESVGSDVFRRNLFHVYVSPEGEDRVLKVEGPGSVYSKTDTRETKLAIVSNLFTEPEQDEETDSGRVTTDGGEDPTDAFAEASEGDEFTLSFGGTTRKVTVEGVMRGRGNFRGELVTDLNVSDRGGNTTFIFRRSDGWESDSEDDAIHGESVTLAAATDGGEDASGGGEPVTETADSHLMDADELDKKSTAELRHERRSHLISYALDPAPKNKARHSSAAHQLETEMDERGVQYVEAKEMFQWAERGEGDEPEIPGSEGTGGEDSGPEDSEPATDGGVDTITVHGERVPVPDGFQPSDDAVDSQVECLNCGRTCTVGVEYGERAEDHACYQDVPRGEDSGFPVGGV